MPEKRSGLGGKDRPSFVQGIDGFRAFSYNTGIAETESLHMKNAMIMFPVIGESQYYTYEQ